MKNKKGFTIVELVIVIAVIAILAAVLIPTFTTVTANARASAALSQAKNAQSSVLGNTEGVMPENTLFAINSTGNADYDYAFVINGRKIEQVKNDSIKDTSAYPVATDGVYTVFVSADRFNSEKKSSVTNKIDGLIASVLTKKLGAGAWVAVTDTDHNSASLAFYTGDVNAAPLASSNYAVWGWQVGETTTHINVYYNGDLPDTCVCFLAA